MFHTTPTGHPESWRKLGFTEELWDAPEFLRLGQQSAQLRMKSVFLEPGVSVPFKRAVLPGAEALPVLHPFSSGLVPLDVALPTLVHSDYLLVLQGNTVVVDIPGPGITKDTPHLVHSVSKTLTSLTIDKAVSDGALTLGDTVTRWLPELADTGWSEVTIQNLLDMSSGFHTDEHYDSPTSDYWSYTKAVGYYGTPLEEKSALGFVQGHFTTLVDRPGTVFNYSSPQANLVPLIAGRAMSQDPAVLIETGIYSRLGATHKAQYNTDTLGHPLSEGQLSLTVDDLAKWAFPFANGGLSLTGEQIVSPQWIETLFSPDSRLQQIFTVSDFGNFFPGGQYHNQAWLIDSEDTTLAMLGIHGQFVLIHPASKLMAIGLSSYPAQATPALVRGILAVWQALKAAFA